MNSPTVPEAVAIALESPKIRWPTCVSHATKVKIINDFMAKKNYDFGSLGGFKSSFIPELASNINYELRNFNQLIHGEASGC